jgi:hypothetical protein
MTTNIGLFSGFSPVCHGYVCLPVVLVMATGISAMYMYTCQWGSQHILSDYIDWTNFVQWVRCPHNILLRS